MHGWDHMLTETFFTYGDHHDIPEVNVKAFPYFSGIVSTYVHFTPSKCLNCYTRDFNIFPLSLMCLSTESVLFTF